MLALCFPNPDGEAFVVITPESLVPDGTVPNGTVVNEFVLPNRPLEAELEVEPNKPPDLADEPFGVFVPNPADVSTGFPYDTGPCRSSAADFLP